jgi:hypothetical protein
VARSVCDASSRNLLVSTVYFVLARHARKIFSRRNRSLARFTTLRAFSACPRALSTSAFWSVTSSTCLRVSSAASRRWMRIRDVSSAIFLGVAVQVKFESKGLKPGYHFIGSWVETRRFQAMGQLDSTCTAPLFPHLAPLLDEVARRLVLAPVRQAVRALGVGGTSYICESKGLKPGFHFIGSRVETRRFQALWVTTGFNLYGINRV